MLTLHYSLSGGLAPILLPASSPEPHRRDGLWQSTCFEAFIGQPGQRREMRVTSCPRSASSVANLSQDFSVAPPCAGGTGRKKPIAMVSFIRWRV